MIYNLKVEGQNKSITFDDERYDSLQDYMLSSKWISDDRVWRHFFISYSYKTTKKEVDFLPLICDYEEKLYAAGEFQVVL